MATNNPWDVMRELATMQDRMNRIWGSVYDRGHDDVTSRGSWLPPVDIYETGAHEIVLKAEAPGLKREDIDLTVENNTLTIRGERKRDEAVADESYHRVERSFGPFSRSFTLPPTVDASRVRAEYRDGVLTVTIPMREEAKPRQIQVNVTD
jgi:HSP20 family protein